MQVNILEAKNRLSQLIKSAQTGEDVVIANRGEPVVRLVPTQAKRAGTPKVGSAKAILDWLEHHSLPDYAMRGAREIEADIKDARASWD